MSIRLGYQMPNFSYGVAPRDLFPAVVAQAREAEAAGFDAAFVMDHFYQLPLLGAPSEPMLEAYTALSGLAASTERIQLSALVTGNTYRNPALTAKTVTTLDVVSRGRAVLGIGAGWFELEHQAYGFDFGTFTERFEKLEEALEIITPMLRGQHSSFDGKWYRTDDAMNEPRVRDDLPILLGGGGEKKTFGLAARFADHLNIICNASELPRKLDALHARCDEVGRDPKTLETSFLAFVIVDEDGDRARKVQAEMLARLGITDLGSIPTAALRNTPADRQFVGTPDEVAEQIQSRVLDQGIDGIIVNMVTNGHEAGAVELAGRALAPLVKA
ncbi:LLM class F420-dependent oxidoreductase [Nocardia seriolae]|uniref:5,10-methylenetetrahydromethanopterin reductase n=2 Tax=Nocardia seriolae TaxID=37332 RepID=A0ABC8ALN1_9NOCA|nr:LLM class F420-dependent oxidoreductase [Nocardia seriolae]APA95017.1 5,10-methylenetetrahydromethanopterin reductase [Nocardia seriolae]MTJ60299.1 TIGR03560 family F420-dependent LLM class oxidoreductase [Nocardia seriolae]MTJ75482.1 TIGR03560 family F420-dependent LLM class oxidoreductase [Nocardia seriolae]MTJ85289.1 TIGR03560 family F420-dependent LLM class oxidoreductase [Nocardia seriolae]MTK29285.1 TIGR03560 family F420-dependent LLM class oxidoreductase [Nocardia seriolae]